MLRFFRRAGSAGQSGGKGIAAALLPLILLQSQPASAQAVVQPIPDPAAERLADALRTLSRNPQSIDALMAAGEASLRLDDVDAAQGFFSRAEAIAPTNGRVKAGLAAVMLRRDRLAEALQLFGEAERLGAPMATYAADWGLAYDLVGDNANAQRAYATATSYGADDTVTRRLAISQAIAGDRAASEATLLPLLQRQDLAAYRARAFALAILGEQDEAVSIAETMLPARISSRMAPYLRYMPRLTRAQQAAAANLGRFPPANQIGRSEAAGSMPANPPVQLPQARPPLARPDARLEPSGDPLGSARAEARPASPPVAQAPAPPHPRAEPPPVGGSAQEPVGASMSRQPALQARAAMPPTDRPPQQALTPSPATGLAASRARGEAGNSGASGAVAPINSAEPGALSDGVPPQRQADLVTAFADITQSPRSSRAAAPGAVDITAIQPRREVRAPPPPPPPPPPAHPSRAWVQLATGQDAGALAFDWRRIRRQAGGLLDRAKPHRAAWGDRTRLLAGPYSSASEAQELVTALKEAGIDSFRFTSAAGEEVRPLD